MLPLLLVIAQHASAATSTPDPRPRHYVPPSERPNLCVIVIDDFGVDLATAYGEGSSSPCTPNLDAFAQASLLFRNAWAMPSCSPMRAAALTGRYGFRTGIGMPPVMDDAGLALDEHTLPEALLGYTSVAVGKWHLGGSLGADHPSDSGFAHYAGSLAGMVSSYTSWQKTVDGTSFQTTTYATTDTTDEAIAALTTSSAPWFLWTAYNAPHSPFHVPPASLCPGSCTGSFCDSVGAGSSSTDRARAMVEALDTELGRLLAVLEAVDPRAFVVLVGDNGTAAQATLPPFVTSHAKGTVYEGGLNVPLLVKGPGVVAGECAALVSTVDLFATLCELAGVASPAEDSLSFVRCFSDPACAPRASVYAEQFSPNHQAALPFLDHERAVRDGRYKLIRRTGQPDELYDLELDPFEATNLVPSLTPGSPEEAAFEALENELVALGVE